MLNDFGTSFALLDQEDRMRRGAEMTMLFAMVAAPLLDRAFYGPPMESSLFRSLEELLGFLREETDERCI